jgi:hypothetical protein
MDIEISMMLKGATSFSVPLFQQFDLDKSFSRICITLFMSDAVQGVKSYKTSENRINSSV